MRLFVVKINSDIFKNEYYCLVRNLAGLVFDSMNPILFLGNITIIYYNKILFDYETSLIKLI